MAANSKSEEIADRLLESGRFASRREALDQAARLIDANERMREDMDKGIAEGLADAKAGRFFTTDVIRKQLIEEFSSAAGAHEDRHNVKG